MRAGDVATAELPVDGYGKVAVEVFIDFVFTHDAPASDKLYLGYDGIDELNRYFESLRDEMVYDKWFYGHLHDNRRVMDNHYLLYEQIIRIN